MPTFFELVGGTVIVLIIGILFIYAANWLLDRIYCKAMATSRDDLARELKACASYFARDTDAKIALECAADQIICGFVPTGDQVRARFLERKDEVNRGKPL